MEQFGDNPLGRFKENWTVEQLEELFWAEDQQLRLPLMGEDLV